MKRLTFIFCFAFAGAVYAETWNCGPETNGVYSDSVQCTLDDEGNFTVSGTGNMGDYYYAKIDGLNTSSAPWFGKTIYHVTIDDGITGVGANAFAFNPQLKSVSGMKDVTVFGSMAFNQDYGLQSFEVPENLHYIGDNALQSDYNLGGQVFELSDTLEFVGINALKFDGLFVISDSLDTSAWDERPFHGYTPTFVCKGDISGCQNAIAKFIQKSEGGIGTCERTDCLSPESYTLKEADKSKCNGVNYYWTGERCNRRNGEGFVECAEGYYANNLDLCEKIKLRYTLPEADAATSDDFENTIEWIFE